MSSTQPHQTLPLLCPKRINRVPWGLEREHTQVPESGGTGFTSFPCHLLAVQSWPNVFISLILLPYLQIRGVTVPMT